MSIVENGAAQLSADTTGAPSATTAVPTSTHTHPVLLDGGASAAGSAHTHGPGTFAATTMAAVGVAFAAPAARAVAVHAQVLGGAANAFPGPFTNPAIPRAVQCTFGAAWDGGIVTVTGTDETDAVITDTIDPAGVLPGGGVVQSVKIFKTVTAAAKATLVPASVTTCDLQTGVALGLGAVPATGTFILEVMDGTTAEAGALFDSGKGVTLGTPPNGAHNYVVLVNKATPAVLSGALATEAAHTHGPGTLADAATGVPSATTTAASNAHVHAESE